MNPEFYRRILGVWFFIGDARHAMELGSRGGLVVVPSAPALVTIARDREYRQALLEADLVITDSGYMVILWNLLMCDRIHRVSGLEYLHLLLDKPEMRERGSTFYIMPSVEARDRNLRWLASNGYPVDAEHCYVAPVYPPGPISDPVLMERINTLKPRHVVIGLGGGVQEKLGLHIKKNSVKPSAIHCIGAAIGFLSGDQVRIPLWADRWILGWFLRCLSNPKRFVPRYVGAIGLARILWRCRDRMPDPIV